jgi:iron(III) transport system permease protein
MRASSSGRGVALLAALVAGVTLLPLVVVVGDSLGAGEEAARFLLRPRVGMLLGHTASLLAVTVPCTVVVGTLAAWLVERTSLPGAGLWRTLMLTPLAVPAFVSAYAWVTVAPSMTGFAGSALVTTLAYFPFVFLPVAAMLRTLDPGDEEVARSLGLSPAAAMRRTVLPRLRPALSGGALLVALHLLAEYGVLEMMRFQTFTTAVMQQYAIGFSDVSGSLLASVLLVLCLMVLTAEVAARGGRRVARVGSGTQRPSQPVPLGAWTAPAQLFLGLVIALAVGVPVTTVLRWLAAGMAELGGLPDGLAPLVLRTVALALLGALVTLGGRRRACCWSARRTWPVRCLASWSAWRW